MTEREVRDFVDGCLFRFASLLENVTLTKSDYPSYELFTGRLRAGAFDGRKGSQLRLVIGKERDVRAVVQV